MIYISTMRIFIPFVFLLLALIVSGCGNNDSNKPSGEVTADSTNAAVEQTGGDSSAPTTAHASTVKGEPVTPPEASDSLKFCFINKLYKKGDNYFIDADYIQFLTGDKAVAEAKKHHDAEMEVINGDTVYSLLDDIYVLNENKKIRSLRLGEGIKLMDLANDPESVVLKPVSFDTFKKGYSKDHIYILIAPGDSVVTAIKRQYLP